MNCVNHPDVAVAAYCQNCGKALCAQCVRPISGVIYCEQCLAARLGMGGGPSGGYTSPGATGGVSYPINGAILPSGPNPGTATVLGFIPGVGAMYNGQFIKALVHVLVFVILIGITDNHGIFGLFIAAWIFYQVFDANQTAKARRDGLPLPDPFGLNELGAKIGIPNSNTTPSVTQTYTATAVPPMGGSYVPPAGGYGYVPPAGSYVPPAGSYVPPAGSYVPPAGFNPSAGYGDPNAPYTPFASVPGAASGSPNVDPFPPLRRKEPVGAIILIGLGLLFLFNTLGFFRFDWIGHFWPLFIIALGAWLLVKRTRGLPPPPAPPAPPAGGSL